MPLALTGLGMVSSLGWGVASSCAAIRAGLTRPRPLHDVYVTDQEQLEPVPLLGHPIPELTDGFGPLGRWLQLAQACVADLRETAHLPPTSDVRFWSQTGWLCVLPHLDPARYLEVQDFGPDLMKSSWLERLGQLLGLEWPRKSVHFVHAGHAGTAAALQLAQQLLAARQVERLVVLSLDSYLDETSLEWLLVHRRLKTPDHPAGLMPGESGACLLVELPQAARQRGAPVLATIEAVATGSEAGSRMAGQPSTGEILTRTLEQVLPQTPAGDFVGDLISDLNGEEWRARAWGSVQVRLRNRLGERTRLLLPCTSLGDVGAASGAVGVCMATRAFARKYAMGEQAVIVSSAEHGEVGAIRVRAPGGQA
ncbi:hypothetical protein [Vitiosangium sp. GDMCC 1.1324]|uniref:hypothetical protein n=1 Tax=Vitiosangium sp. (strain GDMCC 1.1324) TaxID=2138576 RepID=UPI00130EA1CF|nr:hypothetical protein [Vitiosangium sp. GDMCC 1.1324]